MSATVPATDLVNVTIDGIALQVPKGMLVVEAAKLIHRDIPVYCYHPKLGPAGLCRTIARSAIRAASAICKISRWPTVRAPRA
jgi:predicted molibdopterin-dependent oxidoreductase YjgC